MVIVGPDLSQLYGEVVAEPWQLVTGEARIALPPCGYLKSVILAFPDPDEAWKAKVDFELTTHDDAGLFTVAHKLPTHEDNGFTGRIIVLDLAEPVPHMNAACPYVVKATADQGCKVNVMQLYYRMAPRY